MVDNNTIRNTLTLSMDCTKPVHETRARRGDQGGANGKLAAVAASQWVLYGISSGASAELPESQQNLRNLLRNLILR